MSHHFSRAKQIVERYTCGLAFGGTSTQILIARCDWIDAQSEAAPTAFWTALLVDGLPEVIAAGYQPSHDCLSSGISLADAKAASAACREWLS